MCLEPKSQNDEHELQPRPRKSEGRREERSARVPTASAATSSAHARRANPERPTPGQDPVTGNYFVYDLPNTQREENDRHYKSQARMNDGKEMEDTYFDDEIHNKNGIVRRHEDKNLKKSSRRKTNKWDEMRALPEYPTEYNQAAYPHGAEGASRSNSQRTADTGSSRSKTAPVSSRRRTQAGPSRRHTTDESRSKSSGKGKGKAKR